MGIALQWVDNSIAQMCQDQPAALNNFICKQCAILFLMLNWKLHCLSFGCLYEKRPSCCCTLLRMDQGACARQRECVCVNFVWQWCVAVWTAPLVTPLHTHEAPPHCQWCAYRVISLYGLHLTLIWWRFVKDLYNSSDNQWLVVLYLHQFCWILLLPGGL